MGSSYRFWTAHAMRRVHRREAVGAMRNPGVDFNRSFIPGAQIACEYRPRRPPKPRSVPIFADSEQYSKRHSKPSAGLPRDLLV